MRYGISAHPYHDRTLGRDHLAEIASFGFRDLELFATLGHFEYDRPDAARTLAGWLADAGLSLNSVHAPIVDRIDGESWGRVLSSAAAGETITWLPSTAGSTGPRR